MYANGNTSTPAGADHEPTIIILDASILETKRQTANKMPASINNTETLSFILLFFTWLSRTRDF